MNTTAGPAEFDQLALTAQGILAAATASADPGHLWSQLRRADLPLLAVPAPEGAGSLEAAARVVRVCAELAAAVPYADTAMVAAPLAAAAGLLRDDEPSAAAQATGDAAEDGGRLLVDVTATQVAWARSVTQIVLVSDSDVVMRLPTSAFEVTPSANLAGEPRDTLRFAGTVPSGHWARLPGAVLELRRRGALARATALAAAAGAVQSISISWASQRTQFGRPISRFQAVQHMLAELAVEATVMSTVVDHAVQVCAQEGFATESAAIAVAVSKAQCSSSAGLIARLAHQVHGAIGTTQEHPLHRYTTRLWSWRDEFGAERTWQDELGARALAGDIWELVTL